MVIVAAIDRSERARDVIDQAEALAGAFDDEIHVVHVLTYGEFSELERTNVEETGKTKPMEEVRAVAADIAEEVVDDPDAPFEYVGLVGDPPETVADYADDQGARYIVTSGRKRSPAGKAIFGSVAQGIIMNATTPVVITIQQRD